MRTQPSPPQKGGGVPSPIFGPFLLCPNGWMHQDATWYRGRHQPRTLCVKWGPSSSPERGRSPPIFGTCLLWPNGWMDPDGTWHGGSPQPRGLCVRCEPSPFVFPERGQSPLPNFRPMSIVVKQLNGSRWHLAWRWALVQAA